jgi:hypothetical protein
LPRPPGAGQFATGRRTRPPHTLRSIAGGGREEKLMNAWRWLGVVVLVMGVAALNFPAAGQDKDKNKGDKTAKEDKDKNKGDKTAKEDKDKNKGDKTAKEGDKGTIEIDLTKSLGGKNKFYQEVNTVTKQTMTVQGVKHEQKQDQTFWFEWTPKEAKDGKFTIVQKIIGVKMHINIGDNKIDFDSRSKEQPKNPMTEFFKKLIDAEFTITIAKEKDKDGKEVLKVEKVDGVTALVGRLTEVNKQMEPLLKKILNDDTVKQMAEPMLGVYPPGGVTKEKGTWTRMNELNMGPIGKYTTKNDYTFEGKKTEGKKTLFVIDVKTELTYTPPGANEKGLPFIIKSAELKSKDSGGKVYFDPEVGRVDNANYKVVLDGNLTIEIANQDTSVALHQEQTTKTSTSDKSQLESQK